MTALEISATIVLVGLVSAFLPAIPVEPYLLGAVVFAGQSVVVAGTAAGLGQAAGKTLMFLGARGVLRWPLLQRWIQRKRDGKPSDEASGGEASGGEARPAGRLRRQLTRLRHRLARFWHRLARFWHRFTRLRHGFARLQALLRRWGEALVAALRRPFVPVPVLLLSAVVGFPPLFVVTFYLAGTRMRTWVFTLVCALGRSARFTAIAAGLLLFGNELI